MKLEGIWYGLVYEVGIGALMGLSFIFLLSS